MCFYSKCFCYPKAKDLTFCLPFCLPFCLQHSPECGVGIWAVSFQSIDSIWVGFTWTICLAFQKVKNLILAFNSKRLLVLQAIAFYSEKHVKKKTRNRILRFPTHSSSQLSLSLAVRSARSLCRVKRLELILGGSWDHGALGNLGQGISRHS